MLSTSLQTKQGLVKVESNEEDSVVATKLNSIGGDFALSLARSFWSKGWSSKQQAWAHYLVIQSQQPKVEKPVTLGGLSSIVEMFDAASAHKKYPRIEFRREDGSVIRVTRAGNNSKAPGSLNVTDGRPYGDNIWYGRVDRDGNTTITNQKVLDFLKKFAADPIGVAREYGKLTGYCCFCGRLLTDERSVENGFGPICADHYGLVW